jgi:cytochrome c
MGRASKDLNPRSFLVQLGLPTRHLRGRLADSKGGSILPSPAAVANGRSNFDGNCAACHPSASGQNGYGPGLFGVVGRRSGTATGHLYSPSYVEAGAKGVTWTEGNLFRFLADPTAFLTKK